MPYQYSWNVKNNLDKIFHQVPIIYLSFSNPIDHIGSHDTALTIDGPENHKTVLKRAHSQKHHA